MVGVMNVMKELHFFITELQRVGVLEYLGVSVFLVLSLIVLKV